MAISRFKGYRVCLRDIDSDYFIHVDEKKEDFMKRVLGTISLAACLLFSLASGAQATYVSYGSSWGFGRITFNHTEDVGPLLKVELGSDADAPGYAAFRFDFAPSSFAPDTHPEIGAIFLEDGFYSQSQLFASAPGSFSAPNPYFDPTQSSSGTNFAVGSPSPGLPGANSLIPPFGARDGFLASNSTNTGSGINAGEHALFFVKLNSGVTLADVQAALNNPVLNGGVGYELRFGLREVNDTDPSCNGPGDGYVNLNGLGEAPSIAPEPATVGMWAMGILLSFCAVLRRKLNPAAV
jgi:hypothetical protein